MGLRNSLRVKRLPKTISIRTGCNCDGNYIKDIDLKSYQYPWNGVRWQEVDENIAIAEIVALEHAQPIGFARWEVDRRLESEVTVSRLAVKPANRRQGAGTLMLRHIINAAKDNGFLKVSMVIPEINCLPGHPDDVSQWLLNRDFRVELPFVKDFVYMYGQWVDGFKFVTRVLETSCEFFT